MPKIIQLNTYIEQTVLRPDTTIDDIEQACQDALKYEFPAVCIPAYFLVQANEILSGSEVEVATVIGFPFGYNPILSKFEEAEDALRYGADHLDMVINIAAVKNNDWDTVENEIETLTKQVHSENKIIKIIIEASLMNEIEIDLLCKIANEQKVDFVKTSTGINVPGADPEIVRTLRSLLDAPIRIKASGGIRSRQLALELIEAGADRIGTSSGVLIIEESEK